MQSIEHFGLKGLITLNLEDMNIFGMKKVKTMITVGILQ